LTQQQFEAILEAKLNKRKQMSKHHLVVFANYCRDTGFSLVEAVKYVGDNLETDAIDDEIARAYEETYEELMQFVETYID
jgi:hypothetical protein